MKCPFAGFQNCCDARDCALWDKVLDKCEYQRVRENLDRMALALEAIAISLSSRGVS